MTDAEVQRIVAAFLERDEVPTDTQAMALVKKFDLCCGREPSEPGYWAESQAPFVAVRENVSLNRAIVECVAKMRETER